MMCRGLAAGYDTEKNRFICTGSSSHTEALGSREDYCVKIEIVINDALKEGFEVVLDHGYGEPERKRFPKYILKTIEPTKFFQDLIDAWVSENETQILRWLLQCRSYAKTKGNNNNYYQETGGSTFNSQQRTGGSTNNSCQETGGSTNNSCQETGGDTYNSHQKTGGDTYNSHQKTGGYTDNSHQKTGGYTDNSCQKTGGDTYNSNQKTGGHTNNSYQETGGYTDNSCQETGEEWYMGLIELKKYPNTTKLVEEIKNSWNLTVVEFASWCAKNPKEVKKIMGKEFVK